MIDLNDYEVRPSRLDLDEIRERLADTAYSWVPALFPNGRIAPDRKALRCADLSGRPPTGEGSCIINLAGPYAGWATDFATGEKAGPIDLIGYATGLTGRTLFDEAARIAGMDAPRPAPRPKAQPDHSLEIWRIRQDCIPLAGTLGEHYLSTRDLSNPECPDLLFCPKIIAYDLKLGFPALIAVVRGPDGVETGGIHRTYLLEDGNGKAPPGKRMLGPINGGAVQLAPIGDDGHLGVAEGIETALAVTAIFSASCWATLSREHMAAWQCPAAVKRVTIYADKGEPGIKAAHKLAERLRSEGKECSVKLPLSDDDFNTDLMRGHVADDYPIEIEGKAVEIVPPRDFEGLANAINKLPKTSTQRWFLKLLKP